jgi:RNA polymerase sigma-70 factor (ECF subfamily)
MNSTQLNADFEQHRSRLRGVAYRMLGSLSDADDAVQEAWLRLNRADAGDVQNLGGWLTTVVARVCLDMLRSRKARKEEAIDEAGSGRPLDSARGRPAAGSTAAAAAHMIDPEQEAMLADSVGLALLVVLDTLAPAERLAFVLHDLFGVSFDEIAPIVQRSPAAARQLASRARRRVRGHTRVPDANLSSQRELVERFLAALRAGDVEGLVAVLDPDVLVRVDGTAAAGGQPVELRGARQWASGAVAFARMATAIQPALIDGQVGLVLAPHGKLTRVVRMTIDAGRIASVEIIADPAKISAISVHALA